MEKIFTIIKTGCEAGIYGCNTEHFTCIYTSKENGKLLMKYFYFKGLYGTEDRIKEAMGKKGFINFYTQANYGKILKKDVYKNTMSEKEAIEYINNKF